MAFKIKEVLDRLFPIRMVTRIFEQLSEFKNTLKSEFGDDITIDSIDKIEAAGELTGIFTDGSNVVAERRGAGLAIFSATALVYTIRGGILSFVDKYRLTPDSLLLLLVPRFYLGTRANTIMKGLEYLVSLEALKNHGVSIAVFDGSYSSTLLSAQWGIEHLYRDLRRTLSDDEVLLDVCHVVNKIVEKLVWGMYSTSDIKEIVSNFFISYSKSIINTYHEVLNTVSIPADAEIPLLNFITVFIENNFAFRALAKLLEKASGGVPLIWVNKEPESRILTRKIRNRAFSVFTDVVILDYVLDKGEYILFKAIPEIKSDSMYISDEIRNNATHALIPSIAKAIYDNFGKYSIIYIKYQDYTIQISYPNVLIDDSRILEIVRTLGEISPNGYPVPLQHAHIATTINLDIADIIADSLLSSAEDSYRDILKLLIGVTGRKLAGV